MNVFGCGCIGLFRRGRGVPAVVVFLTCILLDMSSFIKTLFDDPSENFNFTSKSLYFFSELIDFICFLR